MPEILGAQGGGQRMGAQMVAYFLEAGELGGVRAKMRLAELTQTPTALAAVLEDRPDQMTYFRRALDQIRAEFEDERPSTPPIDSRLIDTVPEPGRLDAARQLVADRHSFITDRALTAMRITEVASSALDVERASVWLLDECWEKIVCIDLYERSLGRHSQGAFLLARECPSYFDAIAMERVLDVSDAHSDRRTRDFEKTYLEPHRITSMLDVPLWSRNELRGVLCAEHVGEPRRVWSIEDESFGLLLSQLMAMCLELHSH